MIMMTVVTFFAFLCAIVLSLGGTIEKAARIAEPWDGECRKTAAAKMSFGAQMCYQRFCLVSGLGFSVACSRRSQAKLMLGTERTARRWPLK